MFTQQQEDLSKTLGITFINQEIEEKKYENTEGYLPEGIDLFYKQLLSSELSFCHKLPIIEQPFRFAESHVIASVKYNIIPTLEWIFERKEREGFTRKMVSPFTLKELVEKIKKQNNSLNNSRSMFYDWRIGDTGYKLRFELFNPIEYRDDYDRLYVLYFLRVRIIYIPIDRVIVVSDRVWDGVRFVELFRTWLISD